MLLYSDAVFITSFDKSVALKRATHHKSVEHHLLNLSRANIYLNFNPSASFILKPRTDVRVIRSALALALTIRGQSIGTPHVKVLA